MFEWIKNNKKISVIVIIVLLLFFVVIMPLILNWLYNLDAPLEFFEVRYGISDILSYYGSVLTFIGTVSLGVISVFQNYTSQKKTDEINKLTIELQKKSMAMAEQRYEMERLNEINKNTPKFELKNRGSNGRYMNLQAELKNISDVMVAAIKSVSFEVFDGNSVITTTSDKVKSKESSLSPGDKTIVEFNNKELKSTDLRDFTIIWSFQCDDQFGNIHYYKAELYIEDSNRFTGDLWEVQKVG